MPARNTETSFGTITRAFHWLTALLILTAFPLGLYAANLPFDTAEALAWKAQVFSVHKTIGVSAFLLGLARILWALVERHPAPLHPARRVEVTLAGTIHWLLYLSLVTVPLSGWVHHAAVTGFAPILWPFGQTLPFVPQSEAVAGVARAVHWVFTKVLGVSILLHIAGAIKHHLIDRDATLLRMLRGSAAPERPSAAGRSLAPLAIALAVYAGGAALALQLLPEGEAQAAAAPAPATAAGNWAVTEGNLAFSVQQMGAEVTGSFATWTADIRFDETPTGGKHGTVTVTIDIASLTLGSVTKQALEAEFFDATTHPKAVFTADILPAGTDYIAQGILTLRGVEKPVAMAFNLTLTGNQARMTGTAELDRREFGIGASYGDEKSIGFPVAVKVDLTAERRE